MTKHDSDTFSFANMEQDILSFWDEHAIFQKSLDITADKKPFIFYDGPPFATGLPHHGHLLASTLKDIIPRYATMTGHHVLRRFGWDCHGLPIEYEINKEFGKPTSDLVEEIGIEGYNNACRQIVLRYTEKWASTIRRLGRWVDFDNDYKTMDPSYMESVWWVFQQLWSKGLIYQGTKVVPYSTALETSLSNFEAGSNYQDLQDPSVTVLFQTELAGEPTYLAVWTTTPWTLPSNLGICVNHDIAYVLVEDPDLPQPLIMAASRLEAYQSQKNLQVLKEFPGSELIGLSYTPLFPYFDDHSDKAFHIYADDFVSTEDGTGLVHMAPAFGEDDHRILSSVGLEGFVCPIDNKGCFTEEVADFVGQYVKDADKHILKHLKDAGHLYEHKTMVHSYPCCPRSDTPLIYRTIPSWYIRVTAITDDLLAANQSIHWVPEHIKEGRFGKWLENAKDWAVSRSRVWGTPIPLWQNDISGNHLCIGSIAELEEKTGTTVTDLHRDTIDHLTFSVPGEEGVYRRITDVLDCWFESGSMPYAQLHYPFENADLFEKAFPAEFIAEGLDQTRGWFYTLTVLSAALFQKPAFLNVIVNGIITAKDGKKMSKRLRNYTPPDQLINQYGADALRLYLIHSGLVKGEEQRFTDDGVKEIVRRTLLPWYNAFKFLKTYAHVDQWRPSTEPPLFDNILDSWILSRLQSLKAGIAEHMTHYHLYKVVPSLLSFIDDLTNTYIRFNRGRYWASDMTPDKSAAYETLYTVLRELSQCMAPFTPFFSDYVYRELIQLAQQSDTATESVHLTHFPVHDPRLISDPLEQAVDRMQQIIVLGRQKRNAEKIKTKTPLSTLMIIHQDEKLLKEIERLENYIKQELNVKNVTYSTEEEAYIHLYAKPNSPVLGRRLGKKFGPISKAINKLGPTDIQSLLDTGSIEVEGETFIPSDFLIYKEAQPNTDVVCNHWIGIQLDMTLTDELVDEGFAREIINRIQKTRKTLDLQVSDRIHITYQADDHLMHVIEKHGSWIAEETLALSLKPEIKSSDSVFEFQIDDHSCALEIQKA